MKIRLLGEFSALVSGTSVIPTAGKPRQILALLALSANQVVRMPSMMEEIWRDRLPPSAATTLQTYVFQLRQLIAGALPDSADAKRILATRQTGYLLSVPPDSIDVFVFERLAAQAHAAADVGDDAAAERLFTRALEAWGGDPLADLQVGPILEPEVLRLTESHIGIVEARLAARLRLGRNAEALRELPELASRYPVHENIHAALILALYRAGRSWQALEAFHRLRTAMDEQLGLGPSPRIARLHQAVLTHDPALDHPGTPDEVDRRIQHRQRRA